MNWTKLHEEYLSLSDKDKILKWATLNKLDAPVLDTADSYFEADKGYFYENITIYNYSNIQKIENEILRITEDLPGKDIIARITAVNMLKNQPREVSVRERYALWCERRGIEPDEQWFSEGGNHSSISETKELTSKKVGNNHSAQGEKPPEFFYPM